MQERRFIPWLLADGDILALLLFTLVGQREHEIVSPDNPLVGAILAGAPFVLTWLVAAWFLGAWHNAPTNLTLRAQFARSLTVWLVAGPLGILLRALVLGRALIPTPFFIAALGFGGLFIIAWRVLFTFAWTWFARTQSSHHDAAPSP